MSDTPVNLMTEKLARGRIEYTPRAILQSVLTDIDKYDEIVIICTNKKGSVRFANSKIDRIHQMAGGCMDIIQSLLR